MGVLCGPSYTSSQTLGPGTLALETQCVAPSAGWVQLRTSLPCPSSAPPLEPAKRQGEPVPLSPPPLPPTPGCSRVIAGALFRTRPWALPTVKETAELFSDFPRGGDCHGDVFWGHGLSPVSAFQRHSKKQNQMDLGLCLVIQPGCNLNAISLQSQDLRRAGRWHV